MNKVYISLDDNSVIKDIFSSNDKNPGEKNVFIGDFRYVPSLFIKCGNEYMWRWDGKYIIPNK